MSDYETERVEWEKGVFIRFLEDGEEKAFIPENEAKIIAEAVGAVPKEDLRELIGEWRKQRTGNHDTDKAFERAADRLEELIE